MRKSYRNAILIGLGVVFFVTLAGIAGGLWFFASHFDFETADDSDAGRTFDEIRQRFAATGPILDLAGREVRLLRPLPTTAPPQAVHTVRVLIWSPRDSHLVRIALPMWLLRLTDDPVTVSIDEGKVARVDTSLSGKDIARYGPTLVLDHQERGGERILIWTE